MTGPIDDNYLMSFSSEQQRTAANRQADGADKCPSCGPGHAWHGLACTAQGAAFPCGCPTSYRATA